MPHEISQKKRIIYFALFIVFFVVCIPILILYSLGYTIDSSTFGLSGRGGIYVSVPNSGVNIYIGNDLKKTTSLFQKDILVKGLRPNNYLVVAGSDEFWPWAKSVSVTEGEVSTLYPLLVLKEIPIKEILRTDEIYTSIQKIFLPDLKNTLYVAPTVSTSTGLVVPKDAISSDDDKMKVWKKESSILISWTGSDDRLPQYFCSLGECSKIIAIFRASDTVGRIEFYPGRDDAIVLTLGSGVYAMETDIRNYHNFYPIYKGKNPDFRISDGVIYIKDGESIFSINNY